MSYHGFRNDEAKFFFHTISFVNFKHCVSGLEKLLAYRNIRFSVFNSSNNIFQTTHFCLLEIKNFKSSITSLFVTSSFEILFLSRCHNDWDKNRNWYAKIGRKEYENMQNMPEWPIFWAIWPHYECYLGGWAQFFSFAHALVLMQGSARTKIARKQTWCR